MKNRTKVGTICALLLAAALTAAPAAADTNDPQAPSPKTVSGLELETELLARDLAGLAALCDELESAAPAATQEALDRYETGWITAARTGKRNAPPFEGTGVTVPPVVQGRLREVRLVVRDAAGEPVEGVSVLVFMRGAYDGWTQSPPGFDKFVTRTGADGALACRLAPGEYNALLGGEAGQGAELRRAIRVMDEPHWQEIALGWEGQTPREYLRTLADRVEFTVRDIAGEPAAGLFAAFDAGGDGTGVLPAHRTGEDGVFTIPAPAQAGGTLLLQNYSGEETPQGPLLAQRIPVTLPGLEGAVPLEVTWEPQEQEAKAAPFPAPEARSYEGASPQWLAQRYAQLRTEYDRLGGEIDAVLARWEALDARLEKRAAEVCRRIETRYGDTTLPDLTPLAAGSEPGAAGEAFDGKARTECIFDVRGKEGRKVANLAFELTPLFPAPEDCATYWRSNRSDADGRLSVKLCPGDYILRVWDPKQTWALGETAPELRFAVAVKEPGEGQEVFSLVWDRTTPIAFGRTYTPRAVFLFRDAQGEPAKSLFVRLDYQKNALRDDYGHVTGGYSDEQGRYVYLNPIERKVTLFIQDGSLSYRYNVTLPASAEASVCEIEWPPRASDSGTADEE